MSRHKHHPPEAQFAGNPSKKLEEQATRLITQRAILTELLDQSPAERSSKVSPGQSFTMPGRVWDGGSMPPEPDATIEVCDPHGGIYEFARTRSREPSAEDWRYWTARAASTAAATLDMRVYDWLMREDLPLQQLHDDTTYGAYYGTGGLNREPSRRRGGGVSDALWDCVERFAVQEYRKGRVSEDELYGDPYPYLWVAMSPELFQKQVMPLQSPRTTRLHRDSSLAGAHTPAGRYHSCSQLYPDTHITRRPLGRCYADSQRRRRLA